MPVHDAIPGVRVRVGMRVRVRVSVRVRVRVGQVQGLVLLSELGLE